MDRYAVVVQGLDTLNSFDELPANIAKAAAAAINATAAKSRTMAAAEITRQVAFPRGYLDPAQERLTVATYAKPDALEARVTARHRATSLARFSTSGVPSDLAKQAGVTVMVSPGVAKFLPSAFLMRLKAGRADLDTVSNLGLAVRTKDGTKPPSAWKPVRVGKGVWLLYGPSVDQVFKSVRNGVVESAQAFLAAEFERLAGQLA